MFDIKFQKVNKYYGHTHVVKNLNLTINEGERFILLGPSGCGKTTTLRMIAGLENITDGNLVMNDTLVNDIAPGKRNIAMVFQNYALFPHLSVWDNITFGLQLQKLDPAEIEKRTNTALSMLSLGDYSRHKPKELSGGQKQRVALCRALVKQAPYFLLDEPLSNLDAKLRQQARTELVKLHEIYKSTMVYVTHDQLEAMTIADRLAILKDGILQQVATPNEVYNHPRNTFIAEFIGTPPTNLLTCAVKEGKLRLGTDVFEIPTETLKRQITNVDKVILGVRPEDLTFSANPDLQGNISHVEDLGSHKIYHVQLYNEQVIFVTTRELPPDGCRGISINWDHVNFFSTETKNNLATDINEQGVKQ